MITQKWLPSATVQTFDSPFLAFKVPPRILVLHTTETTGYPNYGPTKCPHITIDVRSRTYRQHVSLDRAAFALVAPNGYSTNTWGAIQVEIIGYASSMRNISGDDLEWLCGILRLILDATGIEKTCSVLFTGSQAYGVNGTVRLSVSEWLNYRGILGHQHVPGNAHWDPGALPIIEWLKLIDPPIPTLVPVVSVEYLPEVEITDMDIAKIIEALFRANLGHNPSPEQTDVFIDIFCATGGDLKEVRRQIYDSPEANDYRASRG